jgi:hypothetical protein
MSFVLTLILRSVETVASNVVMYLESLHYLPVHIKETILKKLLRTCRVLNDLPVNKILSALLSPSLKYINLSSVNVDDETLVLLQQCCELTDIRLRNSADHSFSSRGLKNLFKQTTNLLMLDVAYCQQFNDNVLEYLSRNCKNLHELCLEGCNVTDVGLAYLAQNNKELRCLTVSNTNISGDGISYSVKNKNWCNLQELRLDNCLKINDDVIKMIIQNCQKIEILTFYNCAITDETSIFQDITKTCKKLKQLHWTITW